MTNNHTTPEEIARLRSDLATIHSAMDDTLPFTRTDIRFYWLFIASIGVFISMELLGWNRGANGYIATLPLLVPLLAYLAYQWRNSRIDSQTSPSVKKEYRFSMIAAPLLLGGLLLLRKWGTSLAIPQQTFNGIGTCLLGLVMVIASFSSFSSSYQYRRITLRYMGIMTALAGIAIPYIQPGSIYLFACIYGFVTLIPYTLWSQHLLKKQETSEPSTPNAL